MSKKHKRQKSGQKANPMALDTRRGSKVWAFNYFRSQVLTGLLNDLSDSEQNGIDDAHCQQIQTALQHFSNAATEVPSAPFIGPLYKDIDQFTHLYISWNNIKGSDAEAKAQRQKVHQGLKAQRQKITNKARKLQFAIEENLDQQLMQTGYKVLHELTAGAPTVLGNLFKILKEYAKRGGQI